MAECTFDGTGAPWGTPAWVYGGSPRLPTSGYIYPTSPYWTSLGTAEGDYIMTPDNTLDIWDTGIQMQANMIYTFTMRSADALTMPARALTWVSARCGIRPAS